MPVLQEPIALSLDTILFATDFTAGSERATAYATALALRFRSTLELAHIVDPTGPSSWIAPELDIPPEELAHRSEERLTQMAAEAQFSGIRMKTISRAGRHPAKILLDIASQDRVDLIVAATQSKAGIERLVLGSTAEELIRGAVCPVLTIGPKARAPETGPLVFRTVVFANDFSPEATKAAIYALSFAEDSGARLFCCYAFTDDHRFGESRAALDEGFRKALRERIPESAYDWSNPECVVEHGQSAEAILALAERVNADLIVLGARKSSFWLNRVERGLTPSLLAEATCPVLTVC